MDVPEDEDGLIAHIVEKFNGELVHYTKLDARYEGHKYPDQGKVKQAIALIKDVLSQQKDNTALIQRVIDREDTLYAMRDKLQEVEEFFKTRVTLFDAAVQYMADEIFVINVGGYIGSSTRSEIEYATATGKTVNYLEPMS